MSLESTYTYTCDSADCGRVSPAMKNNWTIPTGWSHLQTKADGKVRTEDRNLHFCPKCTGAILDGFLKLHEEEN